MIRVTGILHRVDTYISTKGKPARSPREAVLVGLDNGTVLEAWRTVSVPANECYGGIETHCVTRPSYLNDRDRREGCWATGQGCWHDGSSLAFEEYRLNDLFEDRAYDMIAELIANRHGARS